MECVELISTPPYIFMDMTASQCVKKAYISETRTGEKGVDRLV
jgi:hypothetical protein